MIATGPDDFGAPDFAFRSAHFGCVAPGCARRLRAQLLRLRAGVLMGFGGGVVAGGAPSAMD
jgi:hypothetical protein